MNSRGKSVLPSMLMVLVLFGVIVWVGTWNSRKQTYSYTDFMKDYNAGNIQEASIEPNKEVPTGVVKVLLKNGNIKSFNSTDVKEVEMLLYEKEITTTIQDISTDGWFVTYVLPSLLILIVFVFFFALL